MRENISKVIVTGGAGFIGSHIVDELIRRGIETYVIDNLTTGSLDNLAQCVNNKLLHIKIGNISDIQELMDDVKDIDIVFHEAAIANVLISIENPILVNDINVNSTLKLLEYCRKYNVKRFIFASSAAVYGVIADNVYASEDMVCTPNTPYGASKLACENYLKAYHSTYGLETIMLRYFNVFGPRQSRSEYAGVINIFINKLLNKDIPIVFGDGSQNRDFVYVANIVQANLLAMIKEGIAAESFNIGTGRSLSINELLYIIKEITNSKDVQHQYGPSRQGDMRFGQASTQKARDKLGYMPMTNIIEALKQVVQYIRNKYNILDHNDAISQQLNQVKNYKSTNNQQTQIIK
jgi:UDP-glucose 4-epimerase